jgi:hypothetical protein
MPRELSLSNTPTLHTNLLRAPVAFRCHCLAGADLAPRLLGGSLLLTTSGSVVWALFASRNVGPGRCLNKLPLPPRPDTGPTYLLVRLRVRPERHRAQSCAIAIRAPAPETLNDIHQIFTHQIFAPDPRARWSDDGNAHRSLWSGAVDSVLWWRLPRAQHLAMWPACAW